MEKQLTPKLRFPEFEDKKQYKKHIFEDVFMFSTGKNIKQTESSPEFETPCVRYGELYHMYNEVIHKTINKTNLNKSELLFSVGNEILLPSAGEDPLDIGSASALTLKNVAIGRTINILRPIDSNICNQIYASYYINQKLRKKISTLAKGSSISNVYNSDLKKLEIIMPEINEQIKTGAFFIDIDEKINQLKKKKDLLEKYKKGIMQKIFNQELRFKDNDGSEFNSWVNKRLSDLCVVTVGGTPSTTNKSYWNGDIGWLSSGDLNNNIIHKPSKMITSLGLSKSSAKLMKEGTVLLAMTGATLGRVGFLGFDCSGNQSIAGFLPNPSFEPKFLFYTLLYGQNQIFKFAGGAAQQGINKASIEGLIYSFPEKKEQIKISNFLSELDLKIENINIKIVKAQSFKKGLLQEMLV